MLNIKTKTIIFCLVFLSTLYCVLGTAKAQSAISLSVSPPLFEAIIKPGKEISQVYTLTNDGGETIITPKIVYFEPEGDSGNVKLTEKEAPEWVKYDKTPFSLKFQTDKRFTVLISPPDEAEEIDHFLTLIFESASPTDVLGQNAVFYKPQIGTNLLISVSKDGSLKKSAQITEFTAPFIIDSISPIKYTINLSNNGNSFWKPIGKIITEGQTLKLAEQNVLSGSNRNINCVENEVLSSCEIKGKFQIGKITSSLEFTIDEDPKVYKKEIKTFAFPFLYSIIGLTVLTIVRLRRIFNIWVKIK